MTATRKPFLWGGIILLLVFAVINALPYIMRASIADKIDIQVIAVTHEDGKPVSFLSKTQALGREIAQRLVDFLEIRSQQSKHYDAYLAAAELTNNSQFDLELISGEYELYINQQLAAVGRFESDPPYDIPADSKLKLWLPCELRVSTREFGSLIKTHRVGTLKGHVWVPRGFRKIRITFSKQVNLAHL